MGSHHLLPTTQKHATYHLQEEDDELDLLAELDAVENRLVPDWSKIFSWRFWLRVKLIPYYLLAIVVGVLVLLMTLYHKQIINWLKPAAEWMRDTPGGWAIPIGVFIVISFPPLFGHEVVGILCGVVWGLWIGFGIVCAGSFLGEIANFFVFRYFLRERAEALERKDIVYACMAQAVRDGGFWLALVARMSAIPGHLTTPIFSTCGMGFWEFAAGALLSSPKQLIVVYLGVALENTNANKKAKIMQTSVLVITFLVTVAAAWWIWSKMKRARPTVVRERRKRQKLEALGGKEAVGEVERVEMEPLSAGNSWDVRGSADSLDEYAGQTSQVDSRSTHQRNPTGPNARYNDPYGRPSASGRERGLFAYPEPQLDHSGQTFPSQQSVPSDPTAYSHSHEESSTTNNSFHSANTSHPHSAPLQPPTSLNRLDSHSPSIVSRAPSYTTLPPTLVEGEATPTQAAYSGSLRVHERYAPPASLT